MKSIPLFFKAITPAAPEQPAPKPDQKQPSEEGKPGSDIVEHEPDMGHFSDLLALLSERGAAGGDFGPHNVEPGHHVAFQAGALSGAGKVSAVGRDGLHVTDSAQREHRVHWREVTGHFAGTDGTVGQSNTGAEKPTSGKPAGKDGNAV